MSSLSLKRKVFNQCILPVMTYGCETCAIARRHELKSILVQRVMERTMLDITRRDKKRNDWVRK